jgi:phospholipase/lecithinase/hemolysin
MASHWIRRGLLALASASALLLAACGSGSIESQLQPTRVVVFGDGFSDVGQTGKRYTVNDNGTNIWTLQLAQSFGVPLTTVAAGGASYATGNARINTKPDAAGNNATPTVAEQVSTFLAGNTPTANDLVVVNGGIPDIIVETAQLNAGAQTTAQMLADVKQAGRDLAAQVRRLVQAGATHVVVVGAYDLGRSPWATATGQGSLLSEASSSFNTELLVSIVDLGANVLYVDAALLYNLMISNPEFYALSNAVDPVCNSVDPGPGIGIGAGQVNSALCTTSTLIHTNYGLYVFADRVYPAPAAHIKFGDYAYSRVRSRW